jgi:hypothetical protein
MKNSTFESKEIENATVETRLGFLSNLSRCFFSLVLQGNNRLTNVQLKIDALWADGVKTP